MKPGVVLPYKAVHDEGNCGKVGRHQVGAIHGMVDIQCGCQTEKQHEAGGDAQ